MEPTEHKIEDGLIAEDDISLMLRVQQGDNDAFSQLAGRYRGRLKRFFTVLLPDPTQADDFAQETLFRLYLSREQYRPTGKFSSYLFQIGRHYYLNQRTRQQERQLREFSPDDSSQFAIPSAMQLQPEQITLGRWKEEQCRRAIAGLPESYRVVFLLSHDDGLKYAEIATLLSIPVGTVKSRMAEAVRRLRITLSSEEKL